MKKMTQVEGRLKKLEQIKGEDIAKKLTEMSTKLTEIEETQQTVVGATAAPDKVEVDRMIKAMHDIESRKANLIIFKVPASDDRDRAARAEEDREYVKELCQDVMEILPQTIL